MDPRLTLPFFMQMSSQSVSEESHNSVTKEASQVVAASEADSFSSPSPISRFPSLTSTISGRTRSKVKVLDFAAAQISLKSCSLGPSPVAPIVVSSDSLESGDEINSLGHLSPTIGMKTANPKLMPRLLKPPMFLQFNSPVPIHVPL